MSFSSSASKMSLVIIKISMVILQGLCLSAFATPLIWEPEWSATVVPITQSSATIPQGRLTAQSKDFRRWNHFVTLTDNKSVGTVTEARHLHSTCRDMNRSKNRNVEDHHVKNRHGQNHQDTKRRGNNHHEKKLCGKNQHQKHCDKNQCEKGCGRKQGMKDCGEKRNGQSRHDTTNRNRQNKRQNSMKNSNKRRQFAVDNKVIINVNDGRTPDLTIINVNDGRTPDPTLLSRIETTVAATQVSIVPQSDGHRCSCSRFHSFWYSGIILLWLPLLAICIGTTFCIYKVYFVSDRYHSIIF